MHLGLFLLAAGHHAGGWRFPGAESGTENFDRIARIAKEAEAAKFDMVFFGDRRLTTRDSHPPRPHFSRSLHPDSQERYAIARQFAQVVQGPWRSWEADPCVCDKARGICMDTDKLHALGPVGKPVLKQAGSSGAGHAEVIFTAQQDLRAAQDFHRALKQQVVAAGRDPARVKVMPGLMPIVGRATAQARDKLAQLQAFTDRSKSHYMLSAKLDLDLTGHDLDAPVPDLPEGDASFSRSKRLLNRARTAADPAPALPPHRQQPRPPGGRGPIWA